MAEVELGALALDARAIEAAFRAARRYAQNVTEALEDYATVRAWFDTMAAEEAQLEELRLRLERLRDAGYARPEDFANYDLLREQLYRMQVKAERILRAALGTVPGAQARVPVPKMAPAVLRTQSALAGVRVPVLAGGPVGLGSPAAAAPAAGAAAVAPWMWATLVVLVLLAVIVVAVVIGGALLAESLRDTIVNKDYLERQAEVYRLREEYMARCLEEGGDAASCTEQAVELYPPPRLARLPVQGGWVKWAAAAVITVTLVGGLVYLVSRARRRAPAQMAGGRPKARYKRLTPRQFIDAEGDYGLEVED